MKMQMTTHYGERTIARDQTITEVADFVLMVATSGDSPTTIQVTIEINNLNVSGRMTSAAKPNPA